VVLAHEPDFADEASRFAIDLQLSGHSHGGQIRIPLIPPLYLPELAKKYVMGTYQGGPLPLYPNAGLGTVGLPVRLNCPARDYPDHTRVSFDLFLEGIRSQGPVRAYAASLFTCTPAHFSSKVMVAA
jgi:hypothetical protein